MARCIRCARREPTSRMASSRKLEGDPGRAGEPRGSLCLKGLNQLHTMYSPRTYHPPDQARWRARRETSGRSSPWERGHRAGKRPDRERHRKSTARTRSSPAVGGGGSYSFMEAMTLPMAFGLADRVRAGPARAVLPAALLDVKVHVWRAMDQSVADNAVQEIFRTGENNHADNGHHLGAQPLASARLPSPRPRHGRAASYRA